MGRARAPLTPTRQPSLRNVNRATQATKCGVRVRVGLMATVYKKALNLAVGSISSTGQVCWLALCCVASYRLPLTT